MTEIKDAERLEELRRKHGRLAPDLTAATEPSLN